MKLDGPVQKYLPNFVKMPAYQGKEITLLHLATHTSGLPRDEDGQLYAFLSHCTLHEAPGTRQEYSNLGTGLLGHVIALKADKDYETLVVERICRPLGMDSTRITLPPGLKSRLAIGHAMPGSRVRGFCPSRQELDAPVPSLLGAGSLCSTANDLLKFVSAYAGLTPSPVSSLMRKAVELHSLESAAKLPLVWSQYGTIFEHGGLLDGYEAELAFDVKKRRGIVVLSNCANSSTIVSEVWRPLMDGRSAKPAGTAPIDRARYDRYAGQYLSEQHVVWTVRRRGERLVAQWIGKPVERVHAPSFEVFPQSESAFCNEFWGIQIMFIYPETGQTVKLAMTSSGREGSVEMARISTDVPEAPAPVHVDPRVYDGYVGRYRKAFLFGIICLGPTLNISHDTDELGDHLVAQVRGLPGYDRAEIFPISETCFIQNPTTSDDLQLTFVRNRKGKATHVMVYWNGSRIRGTRISNEPTK